MTWERNRYCVPECEKSNPEYTSRSFITGMKSCRWKSELRGRVLFSKSPGNINIRFWTEMTNRVHAHYVNVYTCVWKCSICKQNISHGPMNEFWLNFQKLLFRINFWSHQYINMGIWYPIISTADVWIESNQNRMTDCVTLYKTISHCDKAGDLHPRTRPLNITLDWEKCHLQSLTKTHATPSHNQLIFCLAYSP